MKIPSWPKWPVAALLIVTAAFPALAQNPETPKQASPKEQAEAMEATDVPQYSDTQQGLEDFMNEMSRLEELGDKSAFAVYAKSLEVTDPVLWFASAFGSEIGAEIADSTAASRRKTEAEARAVIASARKSGWTSVRAVKFTDPCNREATAEEYPFLRLRRNTTPLYDVRFHGAEREQVWGFFAYIDGGFRYLGMPQRKAFEDALKKTESDGNTLLEVSTDAQGAKLIDGTLPVLPEGTRPLGESEAVTLRAQIGRDGSVRQLEVVEGVCDLSEAAVAAVKRWRYKPTFLDGKPVETTTSIQVQFIQVH
ncbi:MAG TPA: energy transducer TonB [Candidatus Acidoferrum sp.]|nr:energy transducer TonB [Candidatus Acidoferrum sp.]